MRTILVLAVALLAACSSDRSTPTSLNAANRAALKGGAAHDPSDTTSTPTYAGVVHLGGRVLGVTRVAPSSAGGSADTLRSRPIAGAVLTLYRNVVVDGEGTTDYVAQVVTGAGGTYEFPNLPGGYYLLRGRIVDGPWAGNTLSYVAANAAEVTVDVRFRPRS
jgi:hypothetical protein